MKGLADLKGMPARTRMIAFAGIGLVLATLIVKQFVLGKPAQVVSPPLIVHNTPRHKAAPKVDPGLPAALTRALAHHSVVVTVLFSPDVPGSSDAVAAARQGADTAHAGFAALDVSNETIARDAAIKLTADSDPAVVVVRRPGTVSIVLPGYNDAQVVAQAATQKP